MSENKLEKLLAAVRYAVQLTQEVAAEEVARETTESPLTTESVAKAIASWIIAGQCPSLQLFMAQLEKDVDVESIKMTTGTTAELATLLGFPSGGAFSVYLSRHEIRTRNVRGGMTD